MSDTEEIELSKEERLEAARKKFEELKKKNKKKNKKGKKLKQTDDSKEDTPGAEDETDLLKDAVNDAEEKVEEEEEEEEAKIEDIKPEESPAEEQEKQVEPTKETETPQEETETPQEETNTIDAESEKTKESTPLEKDIEPIEPQEQTLEWLAADKETTAKSWLDEIQEKPLAKEEIVKNDSLEEIIAKQKIEILELKEENTDLKMNKFELMEKIESLESTIKKLNAKLNSKQIDRPLYQSDYNSELSLSPDHPPLFLSNQNSQQQQQASGFIKTSSFQNFGDEYTDSAGDLRDRLLKWKDWQVDMRNWKSIAGSAIVEI